MQLFSRIPDRFFSILSSQKKELYVQTLFVLRQAFKTELIIRREELVGMLIDALEEEIADADFSDEADLEPGTQENNLSAKAHLLLRKLKETGWIETEFEARSFDEHITIPDYAVAVINLLYELSEERVKEYNSYVYATYAALANAKENQDFVYQALQAAWQNTVRLIDELKSLFNNIRRYYARIPVENDVNVLLSEHFDEYKAKIVDMVYYPLKTIDSVPRFKHAIIAMLNGWLLDGEIQNRIVEQGVTRHVWENKEEGGEKMLSMISYIVDTYEGIEEMLDAIDRKHTEYINASVEHIRYLMNADQGVRGNLVQLLKHSRDPDTPGLMSRNIMLYQHQYYDEKALYAQAKRTKREMGPPKAIMETEKPVKVVDDFLSGVRKQYTNKKIDDYVQGCFGDSDSYSTQQVPMNHTEDFILFLLSTIRGREKSADYTVIFGDGNCIRNGYSLPEATFRRKQIRTQVKK